MSADAANPPTNTGLSYLRPFESTTFSKRNALRSASLSPRNCQRTSGCSSVSLLISRRTRTSLPLASSAAINSRRSVCGLAKSIRDFLCMLFYSFPQGRHGAEMPRESDINLQNRPQIPYNVDGSSMSLQIFNTLSGKKEPFTPLKEGEARIYVCGVTVYDSSHIGHARSLLTFDVAYRYLVFLGYRVLFVRNFTDVDDKIIQRSHQENTTAEAVAGRYIDEFEK